MAKNFAKRNIKPKIIKALATTPVVLLTGARQTGKTTLVKQLTAEAPYSYVTFDDYTELALAKNDPAGYVAGLKKRVVLDEVQRVPEIFLAIKKNVDEERIPGKFILTGSANPLLIPRLGDSLAGRMEIFSLYPFSQGELRGRKELFIESLFEEQFEKSDHSALDYPAFWGQVVTGGYPEMQEREEDLERLTAWCKSYITLILERDVQDLSKIEGIRMLPNLLKLLAARSSNLLNRSDLARSMGIAGSTVQRYLDLLVATFLIYLQPGWYVNQGKRLIKSAKVHLLDSGLLTFLLGIDKTRLVGDSQLAGPILETFVASEILKQMSWSSQMVDLFHFRTDHCEVDLVLEDRRGRVVGIEVKSKASLQPQDFKGLQALKNEAGAKFHRGVVLYAGSRTVSFGEELYALPLAALWERSVSNE